MTFYWCEMAIFASAWAPLERRWEAGDFSVMQPQMSNPSFLLIMLFNDLSATAGAKEVELQGTSSKMVLNAVIEKMLESSRDMIVI
jgi:hypothetical protein